MPAIAKIERNAYTQFLRSLQLFAIALVKSSCDIDHNRMSGRPDPVDITLESRYEVTDVKEYHFDIRASLRVTGTYPKQKSAVLNIQAAYDLHMHAKRPLSRDLVRRFAAAEARLLAWPYFREFVASTCGRMHIPPIVLPLSSRPFNSR